MVDKAFKNKYGSWAIVVGAAEGLGEAYTIALAKRNMNLILVDNQLEKLTAISKKVESDFSIETIALHLDLKESNSYFTGAGCLRSLKLNLSSNLAGSATQA